MKKRMIRVNGSLYAYTDILAQRRDASVIDVDVDGEETPVEKRFVQHEPPESTDTPERAAKRKSVPAPVVTVTRGGVDTLKAEADKAMSQETAVVIPTQGA